ncbi:MAG: hypothetical protein KAS66_16610, partial [Candidatus Omnitrophica bacterium]|nr:hypothetical protein [Candidatus Omnitrophota bacterium]
NKIVAGSKVDMVIVSGETALVKLTEDSEGRPINDVLDNPLVVDVRLGNVRRQILVKSKHFQEKMAFKIRRLHNTAVQLFYAGREKEGLGVFYKIFRFRRRRRFPVFEEVLIDKMARCYISFYWMSRKALDGLNSNRKGGKYAERVSRAYKEMAVLSAGGKYGLALKQSKDIERRLKNIKSLPDNFKQVMLENISYFREVINSVSNSGDSKEIFFKALKLLKEEQKPFAEDVIWSIESMTDLYKFNKKADNLSEDVKVKESEQTGSEKQNRGLREYFTKSREIDPSEETNIIGGIRKGYGDSLTRYVEAYLYVVFEVVEEIIFHRESEYYSELLHEGTLKLYDFAERYILDSNNDDKKFESHAKEFLRRFFKERRDAHYEERRTVFSSDEFDEFLNGEDGTTFIDQTEDKRALNEEDIVSSIDSNPAAKDENNKQPGKSDEDEG